MQIEIGFNSAPDRHWRSYYCAATAFHVRPSPGHSLCVASPPDGRFLLPREAAMHTYQELAQDIPKEYEALKESSHRFAAEILRPASIELDRMADPRDVIALDSPLRRVFKKGYELGYHVASLPGALARGDDLQPDFGDSITGTCDRPPGLNSRSASAQRSSSSMGWSIHPDSSSTTPDASARWVNPLAAWSFASSTTTTGRSPW